MTPSVGQHSPAESVGPGKKVIESSLWVSVSDVKIKHGCVNDRTVHHPSGLSHPFYPSYSMKL